MLFRSGNLSQLSMRRTPERSQLKFDLITAPRSAIPLFRYLHTTESVCFTTFPRFYLISIWICKLLKSARTWTKSLTFSMSPISKAKRSRNQLGSIRFDTACCEPLKPLSLLRLAPNDVPPTVYLPKHNRSVPIRLTHCVSAQLVTFNDASLFSYQPQLQVTLVF